MLRKQISHVSFANVGHRKMKRYLGCAAAIVLLLSTACKPTQPWAEAKSPSSPQRSAVHDLSLDESLGGHTLARHIGVSDLQLRQRLANEPDIGAASTYTDRPTAEAVVAQVLDKNQERISRWLERTRHPNLALDYHGNEPVGRTMERGDFHSEPCPNAIVVLRWKPPKGYYVLTSYPECR
jgi:Bacterial CdiA-CT RNAse A domain